MLNFTIGSDCQSAIHKFLSKQKVISFNSQLNCEARELLDVKRECIRELNTFKIAGHQDEVKKVYELSFEERINIQCESEAKTLIREQITSNGSPLFPFKQRSPSIKNEFHKTLVSTDMIKDNIYRQLAAPYLVKKLRMSSLDEVDFNFRKLVTKILPDALHIWLSKSFTNFSGTAHQLCRQKLLPNSMCRMCKVEQETDTLHVLHCPHGVLQQHRNEVMSTLQLNVLGLLYD